MRARAAPDDTTWPRWLKLLGAPAFVRNVGPKEDGPFAHFDNIKTYDDLYAAVRLLADKRGADREGAAACEAGASYPIPRTTNSDVAPARDVLDRGAREGEARRCHVAIAAKWHTTLADVDKLAKPGKPDAVYAKNKRVLARHEACRRSRCDLRRGAEQVGHCSSTRSRTASRTCPTISPKAREGRARVADLAAGAANTVARSRTRRAKGLFSGSGTPLLIGAGLVGLFLITRPSRSREA